MHIAKFRQVPDPVPPFDLSLQWLSFLLPSPYTPKLIIRKEGNVLFNDALNTFYLRLYGVRHMVKYHSDSEKGNPLPPHRLLFPIRIAHTTAFVTPVAGTRNSSMGSPHEGINY